jgi:hypothetical protein
MTLFEIYQRRGSGGDILKSMAAVVSTHIEIDEKGVVWITGANVKVIEVVLDKLAYGWSPEETHFQHPNLSGSNSRRLGLLLRESGALGRRD